MARYKIQFTFTGDPTTGSFIKVDAPTGTEIFTFEFYKGGDPLPAINPVEYVVGIEEATNYNFKEAFRVFYNLGGLYILTFGSQQTEIEGEFAAEPVLGAALPPNVSWSVTPVADPLFITSVGAQTNVADTCNKFDILVSGSHDFVEFLQPITETFAPTGSRVIPSLDRDRTYTFQIKDANGETGITSYLTPSFLNTGLINIVIFNNTVTVNDSTRNLVLEYSLDDSNWQPDNTFNGLSGGDYIMYIRDQFGCKINLAFTLEQGVDGTIIIPDPYYFYSKANTLRMAIREQWNDSTIFKNSYNTLSCETLDDISYQELQRFRSNDTIRIQFKSNYSDNKVITSDDLVEQTIIQMTNNIGIKSMMDCKVVDLGSSQWGIYFISGKTYDYDTELDLSDDYALNGELPQFGVVGNIVTINAFNYYIEDITYNEDVRATQLVVASSVLSAGDTQIKAVYNVFDYEVYECEFAVLGRPEFNVELWYDGVLQLSSESILIDDTSENLVNVVWSMSYNTDMFYATGIEPRIRLLADTVKAGVDSSNEKYTTDSDVIQIQSDNFEVDVYKFLPVTKEVARKILLIFAHDNININGVDYITDSSPELEGLERSNLYVVTVSLLVRGSGLYEDRVGTANVEVPTLIQTEADEYIKI